MDEQHDCEASLLIVDDHDGVRTAVRDWLSATYAGLRLKEARDAEEAMRAVAGERFDIVLMDIGLPGTNGIDAVRLLCERVPDIKVVMISVHDSETQRAAARAAGAVGFVAKRRMHEGLRAMLDRELFGHRGPNRRDGEAPQ